MVTYGNGHPIIGQLFAANDWRTSPNSGAHCYDNRISLNWWHLESWEWPLD